MSRITPTDLEALAAGRPLPRETFLALLADEQACAELARLAQVNDLLGPDLFDPAEPLPALPVPLDEIARYLEGQLPPGPRHDEVARFVEEQLPPPLLDDTAATVMEFDDPGETRIEFRKPDGA